MMQLGGNVIGVEGKRKTGEELKSETHTERVTGRVTADTDPPVAAEWKWGFDEG